MRKAAMIGLMFLVTVLASGCKKYDELNYNFICKVNGDIWRPLSTDWKFGSEAEAHLIDDGKTFFVAAYQAGTRQIISFAIFLDRDVTTGTYYFPGTRNSAGLDDNGRNLSFTSQKGYTGTLQILTLDKEKTTVTGKFSFRALESNTKAEIKITEGKFNLKYVPY
jgi:hypothetical protein